MERGEEVKLEGREHDARQEQGQDFDGDATGTLKEGQEQNTGKGKTRDISMKTVENIVKLPRHESTILHEPINLPVPTTVDQSDDQIPSFSEWQNENFLQGISQQFRTSKYHGVNDVVQNTPAPSNKVTNVPFDHSLYRKRGRTTQPVFEISEEDKEDFPDSHHDPESVEMESSDFSDPHHYPESVDMGSSDFLTPHNVPESVDMGSSDFSHPHHYPESVEMGSSDIPDSHHSPESVEMGSSDIPDSHHSPESVEMGSSDIPDSHHNPESVDMGSSDIPDFHHNPESVDMGSSDIPDSHHNPESVDMGSSDIPDSHHNPESVDMGSSDFPDSYHYPESVDMESSDFPDPHHVPENVDTGSSESFSDHTDSLSSSPHGYFGDNEQSEEEEQREAVRGQWNSREERRIARAEQLDHGHLLTTFYSADDGRYSSE